MSRIGKFKPEFAKPVTQMMCPLCNAVISKGHFALQTHLRWTHKGVNQEQRNNIVREIYPKTFKHLEENQNDIRTTDHQRN